MTTPFFTDFRTEVWSMFSEGFGNYGVWQLETMCEAGPDSTWYLCPSVKSENGPAGLNLDFRFDSKKHGLTSKAVVDKNNNLTTKVRYENDKKYASVTASATERKFSTGAWTETDVLTATAEVEYNGDVWDLATTAAVKLADSKYLGFSYGYNALRKGWNWRLGYRQTTSAGHLCTTHVSPDGTVQVGFVRAPINMGPTTTKVGIDATCKPRDLAFENVWVGVSQVAPCGTNTRVKVSQQLDVAAAITHTFGSLMKATISYDISPWSKKSGGRLGVAVVAL